MTPRQVEARRIMLEHFPSASEKRRENLADLLTTYLVTDGSSIPAIKKSVEEARLDRIGFLFRELYKEYGALPWAIKPPSDFDARTLLFDAYYHFLGMAPHNQTSGKFPKKPGFLDEARQLIEQAAGLHHNQRDAGTLNKVALVNFARHCWKLMKGRQPPKYANAGQFVDFVESIIEFSPMARGSDGEIWGVENTLKAWRTFEELPAMYG